MHLTISFSDSRIVEAVVLFASVDRIRITVPGYDDVLELRKQQDSWITEAGEAIQFESIVLAAAGSTLLPEMAPVTLRAAGGPVI